MKKLSGSSRETQNAMPKGSSPGLKKKRISTGLISREFMATRKFLSAQNRCLTDYVIKLALLTKIFYRR